MTLTKEQLSELESLAEKANPHWEEILLEADTVKRLVQMAKAAINMREALITIGGIRTSDIIEDTKDAFE